MSSNISNNIVKYRKEERKKKRIYCKKCKRFFYYQEIYIKHNCKPNQIKIKSFIQNFKQETKDLKKLSQKLIDKKIILKPAKLRLNEIGQKFKIEQKVLEDTYELIELYIEKRRALKIFNSQSIKAIIGSCLYISSKKHNYRLSQNNICSIVGISEVTLRKYRNIIKKLIKH